MRVINPPALFELHALAECRGHAPLARRHALFSKQARFACPVDIPNWSTWQDLHLQPSRLERDASAYWATRGSLRTAISAHGRICTDTVRVLSAPSLRWTTWAKWQRVKDLHLQPSRSERDASSVGLTRHANWRIRQDSHPQPLRSKRRMIKISLRMQNWWAAMDLRTLRCASISTS